MRKSLVARILLLLLEKSNTFRLTPRHRISRYNTSLERPWKRQKCLWEMHSIRTVQTSQSIPKLVVMLKMLGTESC